MTKLLNVIVVKTSFAHLYDIHKIIQS